jgi:hypothetical protein
MPVDQISRRSVLSGLVALAPLGLVPTVARAWDQWPAPQLPHTPGLVPLNRQVLEIVRSYPFGDANPYIWVPGTHTDGTTRDLYYRGITVAHRTTDDGIHCSGITFEVWLQALEQVGAPMWLSPADILQLKETWYVRDGSKLGPVGALVSRSLGLRIDRVEDLQPGDLLQFWRNSGKGHSAVFLDHRRRRDGTVRGLAFWSAQSSSQGIGIRYASFGPGEHNLASIYGVRPVTPVS